MKVEHWIVWHVNALHNHREMGRELMRNEILYGYCQHTLVRLLSSVWGGSQGHV
jgi:hypothetical protein